MVEEGVYSSLKNKYYKGKNKKNIKRRDNLRGAVEKS
jgi:hypothetical protein